MWDGWRSFYDRWKQDADADAPDREPTKAHAYRCLDCAWHGRGGIAAYAHHRDSRHHRVVLTSAPHWGPLVFGCCSELAADQTERT